MFQGPFKRFLSFLSPDFLRISAPDKFESNNPVPRKSYGKSGDLTMAKIIFDRMRLRSTSSWNAMISLHAQSGRLDLALAQFEQMTERDTVSWNSMIAGYNQHGYDLEALTFFTRMLNESSVKPDNFTFASALSACANVEMLKHGKQIHAQTG
ncbi:hypothetical protein NE237_001717 [Protea cynaroides]|uniref:Pentatricopeptide repeat-containing protein n=1 Tax=Protea cynaroides TaxID=273540 RepID=A0A9Q0KUN5_9MAGN|nr:hypothetical protein NE237_001717 [Protea cynaroides]